MSEYIHKISKVISANCGVCKCSIYTCRHKKNLVFLIFGGPQKPHISTILNEILQVIPFHLSIIAHYIFTYYF